MSAADTARMQNGTTVDTSTSADDQATHINAVSEEADEDREEAEDGHDEVVNDVHEASAGGKKKKKKKKGKKGGSGSTNTSGGTIGANGESNGVNESLDGGKGGALVKAVEAAEPVLKISRNKHMKYISSYHGPWLNLPLELLQTFLELNGDVEQFKAAKSSSDSSDANSYSRQSRSYRSPFPANTFESQLLEAELEYGDQLPPNIDMAVFRGVYTIRKLVDEASDLAVRAASGLSAAALGALSPLTSSGGSLAQQLGMEMNDRGRGGVMSATRQHRLRVMAVNKLADAYRIDEIAASVAVMQGATALDDIADKVLKHDPSNPEALYVHFFHEKIPSRTLAKSTDTLLLDQIIEAHPQRLEYYRTKGVVLSFRQDFPAAIRNFTQALQQAKAARKAKHHHNEGGKTSKKKGKGKGKGKDKETGLEVVSASAPAREEAAEIGIEPGDDIERQLLLLRGMAYFQYSSSVVEEVVLEIEDVAYPAGGLSNEGGELTLANVGISVDLSKGLYAAASASKKESYARALGKETVQHRFTTLLRKSTRDHERFLSYFAVFEAPPGSVFEEDRAALPRYVDKPLTFRGRRLIHHRSLTSRTRYADLDGEEPLGPALLTTYHPLLIESHFAVLLNMLLLGDFSQLLLHHYRTARLMASLEAYPVFLPARSLNQSEASLLRSAYAEILERLAGTWLREREASGIPAPEGSEEKIAQEGDLACLHHLASFFTPEWTERLNQQAEKADKDARDEARSKAASNGFLAVLDASKDGRNSPTANASSRKEKANGSHAPPKGKSPSNSGDPFVPFNTARAEVAVVWLRSVVIPALEEAEMQGDVAMPRLNGTDAPGGSSSTAVAFDEDDE